MRPLRVLSLYVINLFLLAVALVLIVGCAPSIGSASPAGAGDVEPTTEPDAAGIEATVDAASAEEQPAGSARASFMGIQFEYASQLAQAMRNEHGQASPAGAQIQEPEHARFIFEGYPVASPMHRPSLTVYPVASFRAMSAEAGERISQLQALLTEKPAIAAGAGDSLPILPLLPAAEQLHAQAAYVSFADGEGIRYLAQYGQAATAINNQELVYVFQGLSADGRYIVSAIFPVTHPDLAEDPSQLPRHFAEDYEGYLAEAAALLEEADAASFQPKLVSLDALIRSLSMSGAELAAEPVATVEAPADGGQTMQAGNGVVSFSYDRSLAASVQVETAPAVEANAGTPPWVAAPGHTLFRLERYPLSGTFQPPRLFVYPAEEYAALSEQAAQEIRHLQRLLKTRSASIQAPLPFLPPFNAQQMLQAKFAYVDFEGGAGIRYLTQYGQAVAPVNNNELFYTFQGLSDDGQTYIAAIFPVAHADLPQNAAGAPQGLSGQLEFQTYLEEITLMLQQADDDSFSPSLRLLDELVLSLDVSDAVQ